MQLSSELRAWAEVLAGSPVAPATGDRIQKSGINLVGPAVDTVHRELRGAS